MLTRTAIRTLLDKAPNPLLSVYLRVDPAYPPNQNEAPAWFIYLKNALREIEAGFEQIPQAWKETRQQVLDYAQGYVPRSKSLVIFAEKDLLEVFDVPITLENRVSYGAPMVVPLLWAMDEYKRYLLVLVDHEQARFLSAYLGRVTGGEAMELDFDDYDFGDSRFIHTRGTTSGSQGSGQDDFADMRDEYIRRFHSDVASRIRKLMGKLQTNRIVLGGNEQAVKQVQSLLHDSLKKQVVGIVALPLDSSDRKVAKAIQEKAEIYEREQELKLVDAVIDLAKSGGRGTLGYENIKQAFAMQQVEILLLPFPMNDEEQAAELSLLALLSNTELELLHGEPAEKLREEGGVAARLYYPLQESQRV
jgi:hypothetical protein